MIYQIITIIMIVIGFFTLLAYIFRPCKHDWEYCQSAGLYGFLKKCKKCGRKE